MPAVADAADGLASITACPTETIHSDENTAPMYQLRDPRDHRTAGKTAIGSGPSAAARTGQPGPNRRVSDARSIRASREGR